MADKKITGLLNGIAKRDFYGESDISKSFLKEQLFPELSEDDFEIKLSQYEQILKNMVFSNMDLNQLEAFLTSLVKRKQDSISDEHKAAIIKFWKANKQKIHDIILDRVTFNNSLQSLKWRIDVDYKDSAQSNDPKVIFEIGVENKGKYGKREQLVFEADGEILDELIKQSEKIELALSNVRK